MREVQIGEKIFTEPTTLTDQFVLEVITPHRENRL